MKPPGPGFRKLATEKGSPMTGGRCGNMFLGPNMWLVVRGPLTKELLGEGVCGPPLEPNLARVAMAALCAAASVSSI